MAPSGTSTTRATSRDDTETTFVSSPTGEPPSVNDTFRAQYHQLHRSQSLNGNVDSLRSRFEKQEESSDVGQQPNPKIQLVDKKEIEKVQNTQKADGSLCVPEDHSTKDIDKPIPAKRQSKASNPVPDCGTLEKSIKTEADLASVPKAQKPRKRVSFSLETLDDLSPVPKPRSSIVPIRQVTIETTVIRPEKVSQVETVLLKDTTNSIDLDKIDFAEPEERHHVHRPDSLTENTAEYFQKTLDNFVMDTKKKRSPSFRSKLLTIFAKDKDKKPKEKDDNKKTKKTENAVFADNVQNENFNRHSSQRHTIDTPRRDSKPMQMQNQQIQTHQQSFHDAMHPDQKDIEHRYAAMHIQNYQQNCNTFENSLRQNPQYHHQSLPKKVSDDNGVYNPNEDYVCMDNKNDSKNYLNLPNIPKYDSSSTNTIESENSTTSVNPLQQLQQERLAIRSKFFNEAGTPPRAQDTNPCVQLVNPKAAIPINTERPLPLPYQQSQPSPQARNESPYQLQQQQQLQDENDLADSGYGTVYDRNSRPISAGSSDLSGGSMSSPRSPGVERTKLKLPQNRERMDLQPRLKSPIPLSEVSTDKIIATELLKGNKKNDKRDRSSPSHQKLQLEIDYPELHETICDVVAQSDSNVGGNFANQLNNQNELSITSFHKNDVSSSSFNVTGSNANTINVSNVCSLSNITMNEMEVTRETLMEAGDWARVQRDLASSPSSKNVQITTNALVHVDSPQRVHTPSQDGRSRSITPVMMMRRSSNNSLQKSPPKHEIRQTVEAFCWKELKKLKEKEDQQMQMLVGPMISSCGYAEDPIRRSRSMAVTPRDTKRSTSLPREVRQRRVEDIELNARRMAQQQRFNPGPQRHGDGGQTRPIFNRGSLTQQNAIDQPIYNKKVSFRSQNAQNPSAWPTKNGFTQSPPQRRLDGDAIGNSVKERDSLEDDVFMSPTPKESHPPSREEIFLLNQQRQKELLLVKAQRANAPVAVDAGSVTDNASVISEVPPMRHIREPIYATRPPVPMHGQMPNQAMNENPYGSRGVSNETPNGRIINEPIHGTRSGNGRLNESPYGTRNPSPNGYNHNMPRNENPYGQRHFNESSYGSRPGQHEPVYGSRPGPPFERTTNESSYGTRAYPNGMPIREESIYGSKQSVMRHQDVIYGSRPSVPREAIYGSRPNQPPRMESPYGSRQNPIDGRYLPGYPPPGHQEPVYGSRGLPTAEAIYGYRVTNGSVRLESPYNGRPSLPMTPNQQYYNRPRMGPSTGGPPLPPGGPGRSSNMPPGLKRSNSLRQADTSPEALYAGCSNFNKPPSGAQYRRGNELSPPAPRNSNMSQDRYDFPPPDSPLRHGPPSVQKEPIHGSRKVNTVTNKVCDMYGNIYDANKAGPVPMSPPPLQKAGVLYGQLQRNTNAPPLVYQSHQQLQANNFTRGTRLTASVNDMHRYNSNANMGPQQRTDPPSRPLPPIPDEQQKKSRFGFGRKKETGKGK